MAKNIVVAPVSTEMDGLYIGLREFPTQMVILVTPPDLKDEAKASKEKLESFKIPVQLKEAKGANVWESMFQSISEIKQKYPESNIIVNVSTGDRTTQCAATSAAFVNGMKAFDVTEGKAMLLPILKFSYYKMLTDKKLGILSELAKPDCCSSLEALSKKTGMSLPLISYHINGTLKSEGLKQLGLVEAKEKRGRIELKLTSLGRLLMNGYISAEEK